MALSYKDYLSGRTKKKLSKNFTVTDALIGSSETDIDRLSMGQSIVSIGERYDSFWLHDTEGRTMGFISTISSEDLENMKEVELLEIEVRPEYRGNGISKRLIKAVEKSTGFKMIHSAAQYSDEGLQYVAPLFMKSDEIKKIEETREKGSPVSFVLDWDNEYSKEIFNPQIPKNN